MSDPAPSAAFIGTEQPPPHLRFDADRLREWIGGRLAGFDRPISIEKFRGGQSNPTYLVATPAGNYALRRKPPGPLAPTAHAVDREFRVLTALTGTEVPAPKPHLYCDDPSVIGSEFYIVDAVDGVIHWDAELPGVSRGYRRAYYEDLIRCLAKLHTVDWKGIGLENFGKHSDYAARNLARWYNGFCKTKLVEVPDMDWAAAALRELLPKNEPICLIHGDYGNHNVIAAPGSPRIVAVLDWEMSTIGNPLIDLAHYMRTWVWPSNVDKSRPSFLGKDLAILGIPTMEETIAAYTEHTGTAWTDGSYYLAYAMFRSAAIIQSILHRHTIGTAANKTLAHNQERVFALARKARDILGEVA